MSGSGAHPPPGGDFPPPGGTPPGPPGWPSAAPAPGGYGYAVPPPAAPLLAAHKPGAIPLRPLRLGDLYDAAFKIIRFNPKATVGSSVIVASVAMLIPVAVTGILTFAVGLSLDAGAAGSDSDTQFAGLLTAYGALGVGTLLQWLGMVFVTGMNAHVAAAAAVGRRLSLGEAWTATRGKRWALVGLSLLLGALMLVYLAACAGLVILAVVATGSVAVRIALVVALVAAALVGLVLMWVRVYYLAVPPLMLEPVGILGALGRSRALSHRQFWRILGIGLLTAVIGRIAGSILSAPVSVVGAVAMAADPGGAGFFLYIVFTALAAVVAAALVSPFLTTVTSLQYLDQRIRKEAYDVELMAHVGIIAT